MNDVADREVGKTVVAAARETSSGAAQVRKALEALSLMRLRSGRGRTIGQREVVGLGAALELAHLHLAAASLALDPLALRLESERYEGGVAPITSLLEAEA